MVKRPMVTSKMNKSLIGPVKDFFSVINIRSKVAN